MYQYKGYYTIQSIVDAASHFSNRSEVSHEKLIEYLQNWQAAQQSVQRTACTHPDIKRLGGVLYCKDCGDQLD